MKRCLALVCSIPMQRCRGVVYDESTLKKSGFDTTLYYSLSSVIAAAYVRFVQHKRGNGKYGKGT